MLVMVKKKQKKNKTKSEEMEKKKKKVVVPNATMQIPPHCCHLVEVQVFRQSGPSGTTAEWKLVGVTSQKEEGQGWGGGGGQISFVSVISERYSRHVFGREVLFLGRDDC